MNISTGVEFYRNLGKLFYAVAASDGHVRPSEFEKLKDIVKSDWLDVDEIEDNFGSDAAFQIEIVFDWLYSEQPDTSDYYDDFVAFKRAHQSLFTADIRALILRTAGAIAAAFSGVNKSELIILAKIDMELKKD